MLRTIKMAMQSNNTVLLGDFSYVPMELVKCYNGTRFREAISHHLKQLLLVIASIKEHQRRGYY